MPVTALLSATALEPKFTKSRDNAHGQREWMREERCWSKCIIVTNSDVRTFCELTGNDLSPHRYSVSKLNLFKTRGMCFPIITLSKVKNKNTYVFTSIINKQIKSF